MIDFFILKTKNMEIHSETFPERKCRACTFRSSPQSRNTWSVFAGFNNGSVMEITSTNRETKATKRIDDRHKSEITCVSICEDDGSRIVSCAKDGSVVYRSIDNEGTMMNLHFLVDSIVNAVRFVPGDKTRVLTASKDGVLRVIDFENNCVEKRVPHNRHGGHPITDAMYVDQYVIATASTDGTASLTDTRSPNPTNIVFKHDSWVYCLGVRKAAPITYIATGSRDRLARIWDIRHPDLPHATCSSHRAGVTTCAFSPDGALLATGSTDKTVHIWDYVGLIGDHRDTTISRVFNDGVSDVSFGEHRHLLAVGSHDGSVRVFDLAFKERRRAKSFAFWTKTPDAIGDVITNYLW